MPIPFETMMHEKPHTNVRDLRFGQDASLQFGTQLGRFCVFTMEIPWKVTRTKLGGTPEAVFFVETMEEAWLETVCASLPPCDVIVGVGGGMAIDAAKYVSWRKELRLVSIPTILSVDAFTTPAAGIRRNHEVHYVGETSPDPLIIDFGILRTAPKELNIAGIGDLFSMHTACYDWHLAQTRGKSEFPFDRKAIQRARQILDTLEGLLPEIRENTDRGLMAIVEGYIDLNTICLPAGHFRVEEGSEHYLFYELEERLQRPFVHGYIVGLGIYVMSQWQENHFAHIRDQMNAVGLPYQPADLGIQREDLLASILSLRAYVATRPKLWYTCIQDREISREWAEEAIASLRFN